MKKWIVLFSIVLMAMGVYAECEGSLTIVDIPLRNVGDELNAISYTTISSNLGIRNWDLWINDPEGNKIALVNTRVDNNTYTLTADLDVDDSFLKGEYVIRSKIVVLNPENITNEICSETTQKAFVINTSRTSYTHGTIHITILPGFEGYSSSEIQNVSFANAIIPMNVTIKNLPVKTNFQFSVINISSGNTSVNLTTPGFCWNYDEREKCQNALLDKDRVIEKYSTIVMARIDNVTSNCFSVLTERELEYNLTRQEMKTLSATMMNKTEQVNYYITELQNCRFNVTKLEGEKDSIRINQNAIVFFVVGGILTFIGLNIIVNRKIKERKDNE